MSILNRKLSSLFVILSVLSSTTLVQLVVDAHGYIPISRSSLCYAGDKFWYPPDGSAIENYMCREAFVYVQNKVLLEGGSESEAITAATAMFDQQNEYAFLAGPDYENIQLLQSNMPAYLCSAGAHNFRAGFGDKSGMSLAGKWTPGLTITVAAPAQASVARLFEFCPTASHDPSYFEVYITRPDFNPITSELSWADLSLLTTTEGILSPIYDREYCSSSMTYKIPVNIPVRNGPFILFFRWQRRDPVGEGFYQCVDSVFEFVNSPREQAKRDPKRWAHYNREEEYRKLKENLREEGGLETENEVIDNYDETLRRQGFIGMETKYKAEPDKQHQRRRIFNRNDYGDGKKSSWRWKNDL